MKKFLAFIPILVILTAFLGCHGDRNPCSFPEAVLKDIAKIDSVIKLPRVRQRDSLWNLNSYKEPSLFSATYETYRFMWCSSFGAAEIYRLEKINDKYKAVIKTLGDEDTVPTIKEFFILPKKWNDIMDSLTINGFWTYPSSIDSNNKILDGATWKLEAYKPTKDACTDKHYHYLFRLSEYDTKFIAMCNLFTSLKQE